LRQVWQISAVVLLFAGGVCATGITGCMLNSQSLNLNQCYNPNTFFGNALNVDWGSAFGQANNNLTDPHSINNLGPWVTNVGGVNVGVTYDPTNFSSAIGASPKLARINNEAYVWDPNSSFWSNPKSVATTVADHADFVFDGQFAAPAQPGVVADGAHLLELYQATGSIVITFDQGQTAVGLLVSVSGSAYNTDFNAVIKAYDKNSLLLATYSITTTGDGGRCAGLSNPGTTGGNPVPCNDAPFIGIQAPGTLSSQQIYKLVLTATDPNTGVVDPLLLDTLDIQEGVTLPEPAVILLCGTGLVLIGVLRLKATRRK